MGWGWGISFTNNKPYGCTQLKFKVFIYSTVARGQPGFFTQIGYCRNLQQLVLCCTSLCTAQVKIFIFVLKSGITMRCTALKVLKIFSIANCLGKNKFLNNKMKYPWYTSSLSVINLIMNCFLHLNTNSDSIIADDIPLWCPDVPAVSAVGGFEKTIQNQLGRLNLPFSSFMLKYDSTHFTLFIISSKKGYSEFCQHILNWQPGTKKVLWA